MKRLTIVTTLIAGALAFAAVGYADDGDHHKGSDHKHSEHHFKFGHKHFNSKFSKLTFTMTTTDNGSCGNPWATDVDNRTYYVRDNHNGTFRVWRFDRGTFTTLAGQSPGACDTTGRHGQTVTAGITGWFGGYLVGTVTASSFNANATCAPGADCGSRSGFLATYFAPGATYSCDQNSADCRFDFRYKTAADIPYRHWRDKGHGAGTMLVEHFDGDIATA